MENQKNISTIYDLLHSLEKSNIILAKELIKICYPEWYKRIDLQWNEFSCRYRDYEEQYYKVYSKRYGLIEFKID